MHTPTDYAVRVAAAYSYGSYVMGLDAHPKPTTREAAIQRARDINAEWAKVAGSDRVVCVLEGKTEIPLY